MQKFTSKPLKQCVAADTSNFEEVYGIPRRLVFKRAEPRVSRPQNWWRVYEYGNV